LSLTYARVFSLIQNGIFISIIVRAIIGLSLVWDKILLKNPETQDVVNYVFWLGAIQLAAVSGGFVMSLSEKMNVRIILPLMIGAAGTFGLSPVLQKIAFDETNFVSAYVMSTIGTFAGALFLLIRKKWREEIFRTSEQASPPSKKLYFLNRFLNGAGSFLAVHYISRFDSDWLVEEYRGWSLTAPSPGTLPVIAGLVFAGMGGNRGA
jgi:hypothetical protein